MLTRQPEHVNGVPAHILVVDDESDIRRYAATVLARAGYRVSTAPDGAGALALIAADRPDLMVLDLLLPDMDGEHMLRGLRKDGGHDFPVICCSNDASAARFRALMEMGADDYLVKPARPRELADAVAVQLNKFRHRRGIGATVQAAPRPPGVPEGFAILGTLARGGSGVAYRARRLGDDADCVVKVVALPDGIEEATVARFTREGRLLERIDHPNIVRAYAHGVDGQHAYLAVEYIGGGTLRPLLGRPWEPRSALSLMLGLAHALGAAHRAGIIHRDLKPENVMLRAESVEPVLADFGIAKDLRDDARHTRKGTILGTPTYLAPELITGRAITPATDMYACGVLLHELLTGDKPYQAGTLADLLRAHLENPVPQLPQACAHLQPLLDRLLAKQARARPADGSELAALISRELPPATGAAAPAAPLVLPSLSAATP
jgi:CheY-like chemotaxis protein